MVEGVGQKLMNMLATRGGAPLKELQVNYVLHANSVRDFGFGGRS